MPKNKECIRCGFCCIKCPCGLSDHPTKCNYLVREDNGQYKCAKWPFENEDSLTKFLLEPNQGCGYDGDNPMYKKLYMKLMK